MRSDRGWSEEDERLYREQCKRVFRTEDGYTFYLQADGTLTDTHNPADADMTYASLEDLQAAVDVEEITERII